MFLRQEDPHGNTTLVTAWDAPSGRAAEVRRSDGQAVESYLYARDGTHGGQLTGVTLRRSTDGGSTWAVVRQVAYAYYSAGSANGNAGDLRTATVTDPAAPTAADVDYYRYYKAGQPNGYPGGLKYVLTPAAYAWAKHALGSDAAVESAPDAAIAPFADLSLEYDGQRRVSKRVVAGAGAGGVGDPSSAGPGTYTYDYATSDHDDGFNSWKVKTTTTAPGGAVTTEYSNAHGQVMLSAVREAGGYREWVTVNRHDGAGRVLWTASPSAVIGYDESLPDLIDHQGTDSPFIADADGLVTRYQYYDETTAGPAAAGGAKGFLQATAVQHGDQGAAISREYWQYLRYSAGGRTATPVATHTVFWNTGPHMPAFVTTSYSYTWKPGGVQPDIVTTTLPVVSEGRNGPGVAVVTAVAYDAFGRPTWAKDAAGFLSYTEYDTATGAVVKTIADVNTAAGGFVGLPAGWATPTGGGLHLVSSFEADASGRTTKAVTPDGVTTYTLEFRRNSPSRVAVLAYPDRTFDPRWARP